MFADVLVRLIVFLLPTQLGLHFWPSFSRAAGVKVDYLSPTLYLVDLLLFVLVVLTLPQIIDFVKKHLISVLCFLIFVVLNILFAVSPLNTLFWWLRLLLYLLTFLSLRARHTTWSVIKFPLFLSSAFIVLLALIQTLYQSSVGGLLYWFGERTFTVATPGLARLNLFGREVLRAPATFSHPNSLAGFLLIVFYLFSVKKTSWWYRIVPIIGIILSLSKSSLVALLFLLSSLPPIIYISLAFIFSYVPIFLSASFLPWQSISDRLFFLHYLSPLVKKHLMTGTGLGGFIPALSQQLTGSFLTPEKLQPIHNIFYLFFSELGLFGIVALVSLLIRNRKTYIYISRDLLGLFGLILFIGAFDHYVWTLPQNKLIFLFALAVLL